MRTVICLDRPWSFSGPDGAPSVDVVLPHTCREIPLNGFDESSYQFVSRYSRELCLSRENGKSRENGGSPDRQVFLDFDGVMCACTVLIDGREAGRHEGGFTPFSVEITDFVAGGETVKLDVLVDSTERPEIPPFGHVVDYLCFGGIYRDVWLRVQEGAFIESAHVVPERIMDTAKALRAEVSINAGDLPSRCEVSCALLDGERVIARADAVPARANGNASTIRMEGIEGIRLWDVDDPTLYTARLSLTSEGREIDRIDVRIGWRDARFTGQGFFLNGRRLPLMGLNRHQSWPYQGHAMPKRAQRRDAEILKNEIGVNLVRTSHYPQSPYFLDACDELGLLVFEEIPGWQHVGDGDWRERSLRDLSSMIVRDRNRPSIILWGVRINESLDNDDFYARTNSLSRSLDPGRQTGGVRYIRKSSLLEDVYTFNDFSHDGRRPTGRVRDLERRCKSLLPPRRVTGLGRDVPYLVTEHTGHMFPTKRFDNEERLAEHALRHARALDTAFGDSRISGAIGWCAFDYNTHKDFGSGDRICYHGVSDIFRFPKYAAFVYASQNPPSRRVVMECATLFSRGERSAARLLPIEVWTNCDSIVLYRGGRRVGEYGPDRAQFPNLPHPPVVIRDLIGERLDGRFPPSDLRAIRAISGRIFASSQGAISLRDRLRLGLVLVRNRMKAQKLSDIIAEYMLAWGQKDERFEIAGIIEGKEVCRKTFGGDAYAVRLEAKADDAELESAEGDMPAGSWDTTRVAVRALDQYGNLHPFTAEAIRIEIDGPAELLGPALVPLTGGCAAFWLRTTGPRGKITVRIIGGRFPRETIEIAVT